MCTNEHLRKNEYASGECSTRNGECGGEKHNNRSRGCSCTVCFAMKYLLLKENSHSGKCQM